MNVIAEFHVEGDGLLAGHALSAVPRMEVELEQHTADERGRPIFFLWVGEPRTSEASRDGTTDDAHGPPPADTESVRDGFEAFERSLVADETVDEAETIDETDGRRLYRVTFTTTCFYGVYRDTAAKILRLLAARGGWTGRIRFPDRHGVLAFQRHFADREVSFRIERLYEESEQQIEESAMTPLWERDLGLTAAQRATALAALEAGYYDEPRTSSLEALAGEFGVSPQAIAGRLRRAHRNLVENTLAVDVGGLDEPRGDPYKGVE